MRFSGLRVLVVEDEPIVAMMLEDMLADLGCDVVGPAPTVDDGIRMATAERFDVAVLDINLNGRRSDPIAAELDRRGLPYLFATGYGAAGLAGDRACPEVIQKPYSLEQLEAALSRVLAERQ